MPSDGNTLIMSYGNAAFAAANRQHSQTTEFDNPWDELLRNASNDRDRAASYQGSTTEVHPTEQANAATTWIKVDADSSYSTQNDAGVWSELFDAVDREQHTTRSIRGTWMSSTDNLPSGTSNDDPRQVANRESSSSESALPPAHTIPSLKQSWRESRSRNKAQELAKQFELDASLSDDGALHKFEKTKAPVTKLWKRENRKMTRKEEEREEEDGDSACVSSMSLGSGSYKSITSRHGKAAMKLLAKSKKVGSESSGKLSVEEPAVKSMVEDWSEPSMAAEDSDGSNNLSNSKKGRLQFRSKLQKSFSKPQVLEGSDETTLIVNEKRNAKSKNKALELAKQYELEALSQSDGALLKYEEIKAPVAKMWKRENSKTMRKAKDDGDGLCQSSVSSGNGSDESVASKNKKTRKWIAKSKKLESELSHKSLGDESSIKSTGEDWSKPSMAAEDTDESKNLSNSKKGRPWLSQSKSKLQKSLSKPSVHQSSDETTPIVNEKRNAKSKNKALELAEQYELEALSQSDGALLKYEETKAPVAKLWKRENSKTNRKAEDDRDGLCQSSGNGSDGSVASKNSKAKKRIAKSKKAVLNSSQKSLGNEPSNKSTEEDCTEPSIAAEDIDGSKNLSSSKKGRSWLSQSKSKLQRSSSKPTEIQSSDETIPLNVDDKKSQQESNSDITETSKPSKSSPKKSVKHWISKSKTKLTSTHVSQEAKTQDTVSMNSPSQAENDESEEHIPPTTCSGAKQWNPKSKSKKEKVKPSPSLFRLSAFV